MSHILNTILVFFDYSFPALAIFINFTKFLQNKTYYHLTNHTLNMGFSDLFRTKSIQKILH
ncbi:MAG: hypothetical protein WAS72_01970, partial [Saprospiraceae bacterium]